MSAPSFSRLSSTIAPLPMDNVDTDQIIPAAFLKITDKQGLGPGLFANWRYDDPIGCRYPNEEFVLNRPEHRKSQILLAGDNFGCGSSREHAPWALLAGGIRAVISTRFADIFHSNSLKNGLLPVQVDPAVSKKLLATAESDPSAIVVIDLESQTLTTSEGEEVHFDLDPFAKRCLLDGVDQLDYLVEQIPEIEDFEAKRSARVDTTAAADPPGPAARRINR